MATGSSDHLYNFLTAAGAVAALLGLVGGVVVAILYSRKATATVSAQAITVDSGSVIAVRPSVNAIGPFKLTFADSDGAVVQVTPVFATEKGTSTDNDNAKIREAFPTDETGKAQLVSPGETLTSTLLFRVDPSTPQLLGWLVSLNIASKGVVRHGLHWADRVFVPVALGQTSGGYMPDREQKKPERDDLWPLSAKRLSE